MIQTDSWDDANPHHMVSLFNYCHKAVYGMHVLDLEGKEWFAASSKVKKFVKDFFDDDYAELVKFIRWTWNREKHREAFRKQNGKKTNFFLNWRTQFSAKHLTAYRILKHRKIAGS